MSDWKLITETDASNVASVAFTNIFTGYKIIKFVVINFKHHRGSGGYGIEFQVNASGQTGYNETITSTGIQAYHYESGAYEGLDYYGGLAQETVKQELSSYAGFASEAAVCGELFFYNPSSTVYVKHFMSNFNGDADGYSAHHLWGGYVNTTSALSDIEFRTRHGNYNMTAHIKVYGLVAS